jgi:hypothetical protein
LKIKLKGLLFETVSDIHRESQTALNSMRKMTSTVLLKHGKIYGIANYVLKGTILKEMAAKIEYVKPVFLFLPTPGIFQVWSVVTATPQFQKPHQASPLQRGRSNI